MSATRRQIALLKVLAAAAWADGKLDPEEVNRVKERMLRVPLAPEELGEITALLETPVSYARCEELTRDLLGLVSGKGERDAILAEIEGLLRVDGELSPEEAEVLDSLRGVLDAMTAVDSVLLRMGSVFRRVFGGRRSGALPGELSAYVKNAVLHRLHDLSGGTWRESIDPQTLNRYTLFGAVLGRVAGVEGGITEAELARIRGILSGRFLLEPPLLEWTVQAVAEASAAQLDRQGLLAEYNRIAEHEARMELLDAAFAVASADGTVSPGELEELRLISNYLWLDPREFHAVRSRWTKSPAAGQS